MYTAEFWLSTVAGAQVPVMAFDDVVGNTGTAVPAHVVRLVPKVNEGMMFWIILTVNVAGFAHCPAVGVNVYVFEFWLSTVDGFQVPVIPF